MPIVRLTPLDPQSPLWQRSCYRGPVVIRAADVATARQIASRAFVAAPPAMDHTLGDPWQYLVTYEVCTDSGYPEEGPEELLFPPRDTR
jgi:hypothetical protein